jgi:hypothetical protein
MMLILKRRWAMTSFAVLLFSATGPGFRSASALIGDTPTILDISIGRSIIVVGGCPIAFLARDSFGGHHLIVRVVNDKTGKQIGSELRLPLALPSGVTPVDVRFSTVFRPRSVLILDSTLVVHEVMLGFLDDGTPFKVDDVLAHGPFGDANRIGDATALADAPNPADPKNPFLAIGTSAGHLLVINGAGIADTPLEAAPIQALTTVPQVGMFAFVALVPDTGGDQLILVNPDANDADPKPNPSVMLQLADPRPDPLLDIAGAMLLPDDEPLADLGDVSLIAADGTNILTRLTIPGDVATGGGLRRRAIEPIYTNIVRVATGSLALVPDDGSGVLFDPGFNVNVGGISGTLLTLFGASAEPAPLTFKLSSNGRFFTTVIEIDNDGATRLDRTSMTLEVNGSLIPASPEFAPKLGDADGDGNKDLTVKFDRGAVAMQCKNNVRQRLTLRFLFSDGSPGQASAVIRTME